MRVRVYACVCGHVYSVLRLCVCSVLAICGIPLG